MNLSSVALLDYSKKFLTFAVTSFFRVSVELNDTIINEDGGDETLVSVFDKTMEGFTISLER